MFIPQHTAGVCMFGFHFEFAVRVYPAVKQTPIPSNPSIPFDAHFEFSNKLKRGRNPQTDNGM